MSNCRRIDVIKHSAVNDSLTFTGLEREDVEGIGAGVCKEIDGLKTSEATITIDKVTGGVERGQPKEKR